MTESRLIGGRYQIVRKIAEGGMGEVYEAQHNLSKKRVALKVLFPHIGKDEGARQRFLREVSAPAQIGHDGIVEVYDAGFDTQDGSLFVAMEFLDGEPLRNRVDRGGIPLAQLLDWFEDILDPLAAAHASGIVHRDLKPANVFMHQKRNGLEMVRLLDFGIARDLDASETNVTHTGIAMGTPHYMAPEQAMSAKGVTAAADVWALGVMLYEALAGKVPFDGETPSAIVVHACTQQHLSLSQVAPHVPAPLSALVDRCLAKEATGRPQNAGQMLQEIQYIRQQLAIPRVTPYPGSSPGHLSAPGLVPGSSPGVATGPMAGFNPSAPPSVASGFGAQGASAVPGSYPGTQGSGFGAPVSSGVPGSNPGMPSSGFGSPPPSTGVAPSSSYTSPMPHSSAGAVGSSESDSGNGRVVGIVLAIVGVLFLGLVGVGVLFFAIRSDDGEETRVQNTSEGSVLLLTDIQGAVLFVDGDSRGVVIPGQQLQLPIGNHQLELHENGRSVVSAAVTVIHGQTVDVQMSRPAAPVPTLNNTVLRPSQIPPVTLAPGFQPDPLVRRARAGGSVEARTFNSGCRGFVQSAPTVTVILSNDFRHLRFLVNSQADTTLVIRRPDGQVMCDDDGGEGLNPMIAGAFAPGAYQVYVGSYRAGVTPAFAIGFSELRQVTTSSIR